MKTLLHGSTNALSSLLGLVNGVLLSSSLMAADCTSANIELSSQFEVDSFQFTYGGGGTCDTVTERLTISGDDIKNLSPLSALTRVGGLAIVGNAALINLDGLSALTSVSEHLVIWDGNESLTNIDGLSALTSVGGELAIGFNAALTNINGLSSLIKVDSILIRDNAALTDIDGLSAVAETGDLAIGDNAALTNVDGLSALTNVDRFLVIYSNAALADLDGLSALNSVNWGLGIEDNATLTNLDGLSALISVGTSVAIRNNSSLAACFGLIKLVDHVDDGITGPGPGIAGIPDVARSVFLSGNLPGCNSVAEILADVPLGLINAGLNDAWYNPETDGQGFVIIVFPEIEQIFMAWFTYDTERPPGDITAMLGEPGHRWITAQGKYLYNEALLNVWVTHGGIFDSQEPTIGRYQDGEILLDFSTCNAGTVTYDIPSIERQGVVPIERITLDNVPLCYSLNFEALK